MIMYHCRILQSIHDSQRPLDRRPLDRIAQSIVDLSIVPNIILHSLTTDIGSYYHYHLYRSGQPYQGKRWTKDGHNGLFLYK
jgi:hypothetical protein